ncbi:daptide-type RiPP [Amycolatopsis sp. NPDC058986]
MEELDLSFQELETVSAPSDDDFWGGVGAGLIAAGFIGATLT